jgi:hypothetical protein
VSDPAGCSSSRLCGGGAALLPPHPHHHHHREAGEQLHHAHRQGRGGASVVWGVRATHYFSWNLICFVFVTDMCQFM